MNEEIKDKNEEIKDKNDEKKCFYEDEMVYERYKQLLCRMKAAHDKKEYCHDDEAEYERYKNILFPVDKPLAETPPIFQLLKEHIKKTEFDIEGIPSSLEFISFRYGKLILRVLNNDMRKALITSLKPMEWALDLRQYDLQKIILLP